MKLPKLSRGVFSGVTRVVDAGFIMDGRRGTWLIQLEVLRPYWIEQVDGTSIKTVKSEFINYQEGFMSQEAAQNAANKVTKFINKTRGA